MGYGHADRLIGIHLTSITRPTPYLGPGSEPLTEAEKTLISDREQWQQAEGGYAHIQGTKPQTLAYGLNDSPVGLAAWIVEKYRTWSDCGGDVEKRFTKDELLTTVTIYWVTESISSSTRMYKENQSYTWTMAQDEKISGAPPGSRPFQLRSAVPRRNGANAPTTFSGGRRCPVAATLRRWKNPNFWPKTCESSSAPSGQPSSHPGKLSTGDGGRGLLVLDLQACSARGDIPAEFHTSPSFLKQPYDVGRVVPPTPVHGFHQTLARPGWRGPWGRSTPGPTESLGLRPCA